MASVGRIGTHLPGRRPGTRPLPHPSLPGVQRTRAEQLLEGRGWTLLRLVSDTTLLTAAMGATLVGAPTLDMSTQTGVLLGCFPPLVLLLFAARGQYGRKLQVKVLEGLGRIVGASSLAAMMLITVAVFTSGVEELAPLVARAWFFSTLYVSGGRVVLALNRRKARKNRALGKSTLIVGAGKIGAQVERRLWEHPELGLCTVGYLDANPPDEAQIPDRRAVVLGTPAEIGLIADVTGAEHVILAFTSAPDHGLVSLVRECEERGLEVSIVPRFFDSINTRVALDHIGGLPLYGMRSVNPKGWQFAIKHGFDRVAAALLILACSPILALSALATRLSSPGPVLFRQRRIGRDGQDFEILKFRSMRMADSESILKAAIGTAANGHAPGGVEGVDRRTGVGTFLRKTSMDELPQLFNVLRGEMSLVGPRPERPEFVDMFGQEIRRYGDRHRVKSGITGWAQVHKLRGKTSLTDRVEWDNYYIENWSLALDAKILLMTLGVVFHSAE